MLYCIFTHDKSNVLWYVWMGVGETLTCKLLSPGRMLSNYRNQLICNWYKYGQRTKFWEFFLLLASISFFYLYFVVHVVPTNHLCGAFSCLGLNTLSRLKEVHWLYSNLSTISYNLTRTQHHTVSLGLDICYPSTRHPLITAEVPKDCWPTPY